MENTNKTEGKTSTESIGVTEMQRAINREINYRKQKIVQEARYLISQANRVIEETEREDSSFNSLGVLQGNALTLDREIIAFENFKRGIKFIQTGGSYL